MSNKYYNHDTAPKFQKEDGWSTKANSVYKYGVKNGEGAGDRSGTSKEKRGSKGARNGAETTGNKGMTFQEAFKRKGK